jgi:hypothetical protein
VILVDTKEPCPRFLQPNDDLYCKRIFKVFDYVVENMITYHMICIFFFYFEKCKTTVGISAVFLWTLPDILTWLRGKGFPVRDENVIVPHGFWNVVLKFNFIRDFDYPAPFPYGMKYWIWPYVLIASISNTSLKLTSLLSVITHMLFNSKRK